MASNKKRKIALECTTPPKKKPILDPTISSYFQPLPTTQDHESLTESDVSDKPDMSHQLDRIALSNLTSFRKHMLVLLCEIPPGRYSTYQALADHVTATSHKTCARAVGSAMRNNPFAPQVPCHRVLAADGTLGGFGGHWGENGKFASKKHELLHQEGVRFDSKGKVKGPVFRGFET